jgi:hypothetical protein
VGNGATELQEQRQSNAWLWLEGLARKPWTLVHIDETRLALSAEFDLETGELKWISFEDPRLARCLGKIDGNTYSH